MQLDTSEQSVINDHPISEPTLNFDISQNNEKLLKYEMVKCPEKYFRYDIEVITMMESIWGPEAVMNYCILSAFKHRMILGIRQDADDLNKEQWYLAKAREMKEKLTKKD